MRKMAKNLALAFAQHSGANWVLRRGKRGRLLVLTYHGVVSDDHPGDFRFRSTVSRREFRAQLETLGRLMSPISGKDLLRVLDGAQSLPDNAVLVTFDDGYRNNRTLAAPELRKAGVPAIFFVSTGYIGKDRMLWPQELKMRLLDWPGGPVPLPDGGETELDADPALREERVEKIAQTCKRLPDMQRRTYLSELREQDWTCGIDPEVYEFMDWEEVLGLQRLGFDIGSHTVEHPILTRLGTDGVRIELCSSKRVIEKRLGVDCPWLAYPNGGLSDFSDAIVKQAGNAGYRCAFTQVPGFNDPCESPFVLRRMDVPAHTHPAVFHSRLSGLFMLAGS